MLSAGTLMLVEGRLVFLVDTVIASIVRDGFIACFYET